MVEYFERSSVKEISRIGEILDLFEDNIAILSTTGTIYYTNKSWQQFTRKNVIDPIECREETNYLKVCNESTTYDPRETSDLVKGIKNVISGTLDNFTIECPYYSPDKKYWFLIKVTPLSKTYPTCVLLQHINITDQKATDIKYRNSEKRFSAVLKNLQLIGIMLDQTGNLVFCNDYFLDLTGWKRDEILHKNWFETFLPSEIVPEITSIFSSTIEKGEILKYHENKIISKNGERKLIAWHNTAFKDINGRITGVTSIGEDITKKRAIEEELVEREEKFKSLYDNAPLSYQSLDENGRLIDVNPMWLRTLGYEREEVIGKRFAEFLHPDLKPHFEKNFPEFKRRGYVHDVQFKMKHKKGHYLYVSFEGYIGYHADGSFKQTYCVFKDITESKLAEDALRESEERYRSIFETAANLIISVDEKGTIVDCNTQTKNFLGFEIEEIIGQKMAKIIHPDHKEEVSASLKEILKTGFSYNKEYKMMKKDGKPIDVLMNSSGMNKVNGRYERTICIINDITERKNNEKRIEYLTSILSSIRNVNQLIVKEKDKNKLIQGICDNLTENHGYYSAWICLLDQNKRATIIKCSGIGDVFTLLSSQLENHEKPYCVHRALNEKRFLVIKNNSIECMDCPIANEYKESVALVSKLEHKGKIYGIISTSVPAEFARDEEATGLFEEVVEDISFALYNIELESIRLEAERSLFESKIAAEEANRTKSEFLANMSHELRTPLNAVIGFSQILENKTCGDLNEKQLRYTSNILEGGKHLLELINDVLDISKIEAGKMEYEPEIMDLAEVINETIMLIEPLSKRKFIDLKFNVEPENIVIYADRIKIKEIMSNLLSNSVKFTPEKGKVCINSEIVDCKLQISVSDTGIGISSKDFQRIFDPFVQADSSSHRKYGGTGLGLTLVKKYVEMHGGEICVESKVDVGSTFTLKIPLPNMPRII